jgi:hypothetical protein
MPVTDRPQARVRIEPQAIASALAAIANLGGKVRSRHESPPGVTATRAPELSHGLVWGRPD